MLGEFSILSFKRLYALKKLTLIALFTLACKVNAGIIPVGVQNDIAISQVTADWGWTLCYQGTYASSVSVANMFSACNGDYVMLASELNGSGVLDVLAAALFTDVTTYTAYNTTHTANDVNWYFNGGSMGFAGLGDSIYQSSADIEGSSWRGTPENDRLSWHTMGGYNTLPTAVSGGWRSGTNITLNSATNWNRLVFTANASPAPAAVPEPASVAMFGLGLLALSGLRRRKAR